MFNEADGQSGMRRSVFRRAKQIVEIMAGIQGPSWTTIAPPPPPFFKNARRCLCVVERHRADVHLGVVTAKRNNVWETRAVRDVNLKNNRARERRLHN